MVLFCCKHYREKIITLLPAGKATSLGNKVPFLCHTIPKYQEFCNVQYRCSVELPVQHDGQSVSEHASFIDKHTHLILWQMLTDPICVLNTAFAPVVGLHDTCKHKVKNDHRSKFSNLGNWKEEACKNQGFNRI